MIGRGSRIAENKEKFIILDWAIMPIKNMDYFRNMLTGLIILKPKKSDVDGVAPVKTWQCGFYHSYRVQKFVHRALMFSCKTS